ncbi:MAG: SMC-Scp complex subunit ScpB [gamma proteobacterium symbiont of Taylorina sp.]|nr:SMC-Scp complex subunit ScpB [gamma proteobacterium symbiont of Taylorina sp.]
MTKESNPSEKSDQTAITLDELTPEKIKYSVEAIIFAANKAISLEKIAALFSKQELSDKNCLHHAIEELMQDYQQRGVELVEVNSGFRFQAAQNTAPRVARLWDEKPQKYSRALLETLALIAYRQPITRGEIEEIRGVSVSSQIMRTLVEREWVRIIGHRDVPGKPAMYATTRQFLDYFGLKKLDELPSLDEIRDLDVINAELDFGDMLKTEETGKHSKDKQPD